MTHNNAVTTGIVLLLLTTGQQSRTVQAQPSGAEFPPQDRLIWVREQAGLTAALAARRLTEALDDPDTAHLLAQVRNFDGMLRALRVIVDTQPRRIPDAFEAVGDFLWGFRGDDDRARQHATTLQQIVADARKRLPDLPREAAARAERVFVNVDAEFSSDRRREWKTALTRFIEQYRGTEAALLAEVDVISAGGVSQELFDALDGFIQAHPGTTAAAKALYQKGFQWHTINTLGRLEPRAADPTPRFMRVRAIVSELENGRYPASEWVEKAPSLVIGFFLPRDARVAPENIDRLIEAYQEFARTHFVLDDQHPAQSGVGYVIASKIADLFEQRGERVAGVERVLADLERSASDVAAVRYLRALFYMQPGQEQSPGEHEALLAKARQVLASLSDEGRALYHRKALATLAALEFAEGNHETARAAFRRYVAAYPESSWTWVARLRIGQCEEALGDASAAATAYLETARRHADLPVARVLGHEYAARAYETAGEFDRALAEHQRALDGWDNGFGLHYSTFVRRPAQQADPFVMSPDVAEVTKESLAPRIAQLRRSLSVPGGALVERGRSLLARGSYLEAVAVLRRVIEQHPESTAVPEARYLAHRARLEHALQLADVERAGADEGAAMKELGALAREPNDFAVTAARIARASVLWKQGNAAGAEEAMMSALTGWHAQQQVSSPAAGLETDVAEIRRVLFLPQGGDIYESGRWNAFSWPRTPAPFALVNTDVQVKRHDGEVVRVTLVQELPAAQTVLFFDSEQIDSLERIIVKLGGTRRREPRQIMETPNQPVGDSMQILRLWNRFFPARPGHWGGWEIETYPVVTEIEFTNPERTKAAARVTIGYSGATVVLEKEGGRWIAKRLTNQWVT